MPGLTTDDEGVAHPDRVGRYVLLLPIASGGMGTVFLARTRGIGGFERDVALKLSHSHLKSPEFTVALLDEVILAAGIRHPNVVSVLDVGEDPYGLFVVMEYVEGDSLSGVARRAKKAGKPLPVPIALRLMDDALGGLHAAHELLDADGNHAGLVHRDFSPQNILVGVDGLAKLTDFGVAKALGRLSQTTSGAIKGKVAYMSPEQARGDALDRRVDIWAAGVVTWELLTGTRLYKGIPDAVALLKIVSERPPRVRMLNSSIPAELDEVVAKALDPDLDTRLKTADELAQELARAARQTVGMAERREVATLVKELLGPALASRRGKVKRIVELKEQMGLLTRLPDRRSRERVSLADASPFVSTDPSSAPSISEVLDDGDGPRTDTLGLASTRRGKPIARATRGLRRRLPLVAGVSGAALLALIVGLSLQTEDKPGRMAHLAFRHLPEPKPAEAPPARTADPTRSVELSVNAD
ncbi:MAG: serine/threonine-protein kinase, partial [Polyangiaceae bacterium]